MIYHLLIDITASKSISEAKKKKIVVKKREWLIINNLAIKRLKNKTLKKKGVVDPAAMAKAEPVILLKTL